LEIKIKFGDLILVGIYPFNLLSFYIRMVEDLDLFFRIDEMLGHFVNYIEFICIGY